MDMIKTITSLGALAGYSLSVVGVNKVNKSVANRVTKENVDKKISALPEEERTDENVAKIIDKESLKNNTLAAIGTILFSAVIGTVSTYAIGGIDSGDSSGSDDTVPETGILSLSNYYFNNL